MGLGFELEQMIIAPQIMSKKKRTVEETYFIVSPQENIPGCLAVVLPQSQLERTQKLESDGIMLGRTQRYIVKAILACDIPLSVPLQELLKLKNTSHLTMEGDVLS